MPTLVLSRIGFEGRHGATAAERRASRRFEVDVEVEAPLEAAQVSCPAEDLDTSRGTSALHSGRDENDIEGTGRPRVEPSFMPGVVERMIAVPDAASVATARALEPVLGRRVGASTGTNVWGALTLADQMQERGEAGSIVTLLCDSGERYAQTYFDDAWLAEQGLDIASHSPTITRWLGRPRP